MRGGFLMKELVKVQYENNQPTVLGRDLHEALEINTKYADWFPRMCEYGFEEGNDYCSILRNRSDGLPGKPLTDHQLTIDMAKELCMIQRTEKGKQCRRYFLEIEKAWNSPEKLMARALQFANQELSKIRHDNKLLENTVAIQDQQILEMKPKASYYDVVLNCKDAVAITAIAKDYGKSGRWLNEYLHGLGVQFRQGKIWLLYQKYAQHGYTATKTHSYPGSDGLMHSKIHTYWTQKGRLFIYELLKSKGILPLIEQEF